ncbi:filamin-C-like isoform X3 [Girardinichthys multiradiatus]|uniref:filamin-C-like isoform X3 n=1 Tax=Girardinichthys multiradiatus TaxID=208333 RepID=UPI001FAC5927|nr:filamin-C-like isoform X3 [Girardinichthys multiradiatus]
MMKNSSFLEPQQLFFHSPADPAEEEEEEEEEMPATEKDLAEDAPWKKIQQNTFTRWCNEHLKVLNKRIADLQKDLSDGLKLIGLLEVLSQKKMYRKYHLRPNFRQMKLENVSVALEFLEREHIKLVSIDSKAIVDGNLKLILGLIWTLILHYSISMPMWEDEGDEDAKKLTPKQRLLGWIQNKVPQLPITNFHRDWRDGKALGALVDNCAPGLCPDWETWDPSQPVENAREAMQHADDWLGVPQVIAPEEIVDPNVDEHSVMTYLSQFPKAKLKPGAPLRAKTLHPKRAKAYGPGVEARGNMVLKPAEFLVETVEAGMGEVLVYVEDPEGHTEEARVIPNNDKNRTYSVVYLPKVEGLHKVKVLFAGQDIDRSPFMVNVSKAMGDPTRVQARGPGLQPMGNVANKPTYFDIYTAGAGAGDVGVIIVDSNSRRDTVEIVLENRGDSIFRCTYVPVLEGPHTIYVTFAGQQIPRSPFTVSISEVSQSAPPPDSLVQIVPQSIRSPPSEKTRRAPPPTPPKPRRPTCNPNSCRASGRGLQQKGLRVKEVADFKVYTKGAGSGELKVTVKGPKGLEEPVKVLEMENDIYECNYYPITTGKYIITITWGGHSIPRSPFEVHVSEEAGPQKVRALGPGLETGMVGKSADFVVEAIGTEVGTLGFSIEGPSQAKIECDDKGDGSCDVRYWPTEPGDYAVHIICDDEDIKDSPFMAHILPAAIDVFPEKVKCYGPGLEPLGCIVNKPADFTIDSSVAGRGELRLYAQDADGFPIDIQITDNGDCTYFCVYIPTKPIKHTVIITWGEVNVPNSPFRVIIGEGSHPENVKVYGPGVEKTGLKANEPTYFTVDCSEAGQGDVSIGIKCAPGVVGPAEADIDFDIIKNDNDTFTVKYMPPGSGQYTIMVLFADQEIPISPFRIKVDPSHDAAKVRAEGPGLNRTGVEVGKPTHFTIYTKGAGKAKPEVHFIGVAKAEAVRDFEIIDNHDYSYTVRYTVVQQGNMSITVCHGGDPIPKSPFSITVAPPLDLSKVKVQGLNNKVDVGKDQDFSITTRRAGGQGKLDVMITSPSRHPVPIKLESGTANEVHTVKYIPPEEGLYRMDISYDGNPIPGSPFTVEGIMPPDPSKVQAYGPGLQGGLVGKPAPFAINTKGAGTGGLGLTVEGPCEAKIECQDNGDGSCSVSYLPTEPGEYAINILFADQHVPGSPFKAVVQSVFDPSKVMASGPGLEWGKVNETGSFIVDSSKAGEAELTIEIISDNGSKAEVHVQNNSDGTYSITYIPQCPGMYTITIKYGGHMVPKFPVHLQVDPAVDTSGVKVYGPGVEPRGILREVTTHFMVDTRAHHTSGGSPIKVHVSNPSGTNTDAYVSDQGDGTYRVEYTPYEDGLHLIEVLLDNVSVPKSPFRVSVTEGCDPSRVRAFGPGLEEGLVNKSNSFTVETRGAGTGGLGLAIEGPSEAKMSCQDNKDGSCSVDYIPFTPGEYDVNISFGGLPILGSPFHVPVQQVVDPSKVRCSGPGLGGGVRAHVPQTFTVDSSKAGVAPLEVQIYGPAGVTEPVSVTDNGDGTHTVNYTPASDGPYTVCVKYADQEVPRSPFKIKTLPAHDASKVRARGPGLNASGVPASLPVEFTIDARDAGEGLLTVQILDQDRCRREASVFVEDWGRRVWQTHIVKKTIPFSILKRGCDPEGKPKKATIRDNRDGTYTVSYVPDIAGRYTITIKYGGDEIPYSPYRIHAVPTGDASKCLVTVSIGGHGLGSGVGQTIQIGKETVITVDAKAAGKGKVTCKVSTPDGAELDVDVVENADGTFDIYYTAPEPGQYIITIRFGGEHIPNSPFHVLATDDPISPADGMEPVLRPFSLVIPFTVQKGEITGEVRMPSGQTACPNITDNKDGTVTVKYSPTERGLHEMDIKYDGNHIPGSPIQFFVDAINSGHVTAYGPGLSHGTVNRPATFTIVTKDAGEGGLSLAVEGPSKAEISCTDNKDGTCTVSYLPTAPGDYSIIVKFDDKNIPGSPFMAKITGDESMRTSQLNVGTASEVSLKITETDLSSLMATIRAPSGHEEPCLLKRLPNRHIGISFTPKEVGEHVVSVKKSGKHVTNSPFKIMVGQSEIGDASRVMVYGQGLVEVHTFEVAEFIVDTRNAGYGGLGLSIEGPSKVDINCEDVEDGTCKVTYCPTEPGNYIINIKFADQHVPGSPFTVKTFGEGRMKESITRKRQAPSIATIGSTCDLNLKIPGNWFQMVSAQERLTRTFTRSSHTYTRTERTEISKTQAGETKREVRVEESTQVGGDPFRDVFGDFLGRESLSGFSGMPAGSRPQLQDGEAGNQEMTAQVTSPGGKTEGAEIIKGEDSTYSVRFVPQEMGPHIVNVKYRSQHVPGSPFQFTVGPLGEGGAHKVRAGGTGLDRGVAGLPAEFSIWTREAGAGGLSIAVEGPSKAEITFEDQKDGSCGVSYVVQEPGDYEVSIKFNEEHIPDSPFIVPVASLSDDARHLTITSLQEMGLKVGQEASFAVQLNGARGLIDAKIHTPSGATEECHITELDSDQHAIRFIPKENGVHSIDVRFNGSHVPGSPFKICVGEPGQVGDPGLVSAFGPGLEGGTTGVASEFMVNTCNAGSGALSVTIDGPSKVKMDCQECPEGYKVAYTPMAPGSYLISIKYGGPQHIVGSPFKAKVSGPRLSGGHNLHEMSSVLVETVTKTSAMGGAFASFPKFSSDASKVISRGAGLSKAFIGQKNTFTVDCSKAGTNMLMVGVHGPKIPCEEVYVKHMGNRMYNVTYTVKEQGSYILIVKWGDENIPGSPFHVTVP